ncbi:MAG: choice-of-anchor B family protein [Gemmatimonadetes bacterium]|nr:choice-of-anchor B family protein [Gemmatimonadota bacterium]
MRFVKSVFHLFADERFLNALGVSGVLALGGLFLGAPASISAQAFGGAVLVADGQVLVGEAAHERDPGTVRGYTFDGEWTEVWSLRAPEPAVQDGFGRALARSGDHLLVGADGGDEGRVYVYSLAEVRTGDAEPIQVLTGAGLDGFGASLMASGGEMIAVATSEADGRVLATFGLGDDGMWSRGSTVALPDDVGEQFALGDGLLASASATGRAAHVFERDASGAWGPPTELAPPDAEGAEFAMFGLSVAVAGDEVLVGQMTLRGPRQPLLHRFARIDGDWTAIGTVSPEDDRDEGFGMSLGTDGATLLVGGGLLLSSYTRQGDEWVLTGATEMSDATGDGRIVVGSRRLDFADGVAAFGDPGADFGLGAVTVFSNESGTWARTGHLTVEYAPLPAISGGEIPCADGDAAGYDCDHVDLLSFVPWGELGAGRGARLNDVWGWTDPETGREYALVGRMDGTAFVDVTDASNPRYLGNLAMTEGSRANSWRDIKVFKDHAFVVADGAGQHGMQIFDLTRLRDVTEPQEFEATAIYTGIASSHNVAINEDTGFAYLVGSSDGGETCGGGSHMVDINDPLNPVFAGCFAHPNTGRRNTGNSHDTQCVIYHGPDQDYVGREICVNSNETALSIADVTDKDNPVAVAAADYPNVAYAHQGWLTEDHRYFYSNDELDEVGGLVEATRTLIWDLQDLDDPLLLSEYMNPTNATDHNLYVHGDRLYMSNNRAGLRVLDISDPENPTELGHFDTTPWSRDEAGFDGTWSVYPYFESGTVLLSSRREGLFIVRPRARRLIP